MGAQHLRSLPYYGGKALLAGWIAPLLPVTPIYVEPFAGMASVLLAREQVEVEVLNDLDGDVVNWWRVVKEQPEELAQALACTPFARAEYQQARALLDTEGGSPLDRAVAVAVCLRQSRQARLGVHPDSPTSHKGPPTWYKPKPSQIGAGVLPHQYWATWPRELAPLAARLQTVVLEQCDALELIAKFAPSAEATLYLDPPYRHVDGYRHTVNHQALADLLLDSATKANIAVSDYAGGRPELEAAGWQAHTNITRTMIANTTPDDQRTECLWTNYQLPQQTLFAVG